MWNNYLDVLADHTASLLNRIAAGGPFTARFQDLSGERPPAYEMAARISFEGVLSATRKKARGHLICGIVSLTADRPLLKALASYMGLEADSLLETETGPQDIFNEFLNIFTGLVGASWSECGFEINFSTPCALSGRIPPPPSSEFKTFHLIVAAEAGPQVDILVAFREHGRPKA